ncbi:MAG: citrate/2-methylcitrate synthase, partial [Gammaproteobacteria bacterium]
MSDAKKKTGGLADIIAGESAIATVGKEGAGLTYRGYDIYDLAENACFEEIAYLLLYGNLPNRAELDGYVSLLKTLRGLPATLKETLENIPATSHPMDVLRTGCSMLGNLEPEGDFSNQVDVANRLVAIFPSILIYWYRYHADGARIETTTDDDTIAGHFLHLLHDKPPSERHRKALDVSLILYAEHEFNASTFTARVIAATLSDFHSAVTGAIGALRGPLHGGANEAAMELIERFGDAESARTGTEEALANKEKIMGFGHRVYTTSDPRNKVVKTMSRELALEVGDDRLY